MWVKDMPARPSPPLLRLAAGQPAYGAGSAVWFAGTVLNVVQKNQIKE